MVTKLRFLTLLLINAIINTRPFFSPKKGWVRGQLGCSHNTIKVGMIQYKLGVVIIFLPPFRSPYSIFQIHHLYIFTLCKHPPPCCGLVVVLAPQYKKLPTRFAFFKVIMRSSIMQKIALEFQIILSPRITLEDCTYVVLWCT